MPLQLACIGVERDHGAAVKIVALARVAIPIRPGIAGSPESEIGFRIVGAGFPDRRAAVQIRIARPSLIARLSGTGHRVKAPNLFASVRVKGRDEAADAVLAAGHASDHLVLHHQRRMRHRVALLGIGDLVLP